MNNYNRYYDRQNSQNYRQYDLWQNSTFNSGFNLQSEFYNASCDHSTNGWSSSSRESEKKEEISDSKNRRIVRRETLFEDPDVFYGQGHASEELSENNQPDGLDLGPYPMGYDWTRQNWRKAGEGSSKEPVQGSSRSKKGKLQKKLTEALSQPVQMSKAESMMQKMGWEGGALGKSGDGIVEPIAPNADYATKTVGFGQAVRPPKTPENPKQDSKKDKDYFKTNVLLHILEFVKNDSEVEIVFDQKLFKDERKNIHQIVDEVNSDEMQVVNQDSVSQMDIVGEIHRYNKFVLGTQSEGVLPERRLCLYKEAPQHLYLVTPEDLKNDAPENDATDDKSAENHSADEKNDTKTENEEEKNKHIIKNKSDGKMDVDDEETNPFLRSITRNLKNNKDETSEEKISSDFECCSIDKQSKEPDSKEKIIEFFIEFAEQEVYKEFRFLGPFDSVEIDVINGFFSNISSCVKRGECIEKDYEVVLKMLENKCLDFEIKEDCNGCAVIYKLERDEQKKS